MMLKAKTKAKPKKKPIKKSSWIGYAPVEKKTGEIWGQWCELHLHRLTGALNDGVTNWQSFLKIDRVKIIKAREVKE